MYKPVAASCQGDTLRSTPHETAMLLAERYRAVAAAALLACTAGSFNTSTLHDHCRHWTGPP